MDFQDENGHWSFDGLTLSGRYAPATGFSLVVTARPARMKAPIFPQDSSKTGTLELEAKGGLTHFEVERFNVTLPPFLMVEAAGRAQRLLDGLVVEAKVPYLVSSGPALGNLLSRHMSVPIGMESCRVEGLHVAEGFIGSRWSAKEIGGQLTCEGLEWGGHDDPFFAGDLAVTIEGAGEEALFTVDLGEGRSVEARLDGATKHIEFSTGVWTGEQLAAMASASYKAAFDRMPPVSATGDLDVTSGGDYLSGEKLTLSLGEAGQVSLSTYRLGRAPVLKGGAEAAVELSLAQFAETLGLYGLAGQVSGRGPVQFEGASLSATLSAKLAGFAVGAMPLPEGEIDLAGTVKVDMGAKLLRAIDVQVRSGSITAAVGEAAWDLSSGKFEAPFDVDGDLGILVEQGLLDEANGAIQAKGSLNASAEGLVVGVDRLDAAAESFVLAQAWAAGSNASLAGALHYAEDFSGAGTATAEELLAAGAALRDIRLPLTLGEARLAVRDGKASLFGGTATMDGSFALLEENRPLRFDVRLEDADLGIFTDQMKPPEVVMTGKVEGRCTGLFAAGQFQEFEVALHSGGDFTLNRSAIQKILLSDYASDVSGGKELGKIIDQVVGVDEQRPFDGATLAMTLDDGQLTGTARLDSESLGLTIDLSIEPETIAQALRLRQESQMEDITEVRFEAVE